jgi:hypothetical protein
MKHIKLFEQFLNESAEIPAAFMADKTVVQGGDAYTAADFNEVVSKLKACGNVKVPVRPSGMSPIIEITLKKQPIKITYMKDVDGNWMALMNNSKGDKSIIKSVKMNLQEFVDACDSVK